MRLTTLLLVAALATTLTGCGSDDDQAARPEPSATPTVTVSEETADVPQGSGKGTVSGRIGTATVDDPAWTVGCRDAGGGSVEINAVGDAPNTIQANLQDGKITQLVVSYDELLSTGTGAPAVTVGQTADGFTLSGKVDVAGGKSVDLQLDLTCGA